MSVILVRHADPEDESPTGDAGRVLTALGRRQARDTAEWLQGVVAELPPIVLSSPLARALQTAEILVSTWGASTVATSGALRPGQSLAAASNLAHADGDRGLVGHQPMMSELAAQLLGRALPFAFERGGALVLDVEPRGGLRFRAYRVPFGEPILTL